MKGHHKKLLDDIEKANFLPLPPPPEYFDGLRPRPRIVELGDGAFTFAPGWQNISDRNAFAPSAELNPFVGGDEGGGP